jgi:hypothetical protein
MNEPGLDGRWQDKNGEIRHKRNDTHAGTLSKDYPEFDQFRADKELGNIKKDLGLPPDASIKDVQKKLR